MEFVTITDSENNKFSYKRYKGYTFDTELIGNVGDQLDKISKLRCRPEDVLLGVFPKSGTHWLYNTVKMLQTGSLTYSGSPTFIECDELSLIEEMESPRAFVCHLRYRFLPEEMKRGTGKVITITRNPKDVAVSYYHMAKTMGDVRYQGTFDRFLKIFVTEKFWYGSWFSWMKDMHEWKAPNLLCLSYEDFKMNTYANVINLAKFLDVDHGDEFLQDVTQSIQFEKLKQMHKDTPPPNDRWTHAMDDGRLPIFRKGEIGDWKNTFTVAQNEWFDTICGEKIKEFGLEIDVTYD